MAGCTCENWSIQDLSSALQDMHKDNKRIVVPMFQRGKRWNTEQEKVFIDSLIKGYPVGTMLFYETLEDNKKSYILVDGLQRGNSIKKYMTNPTAFFYDDSISDEFCSEIIKIIGAETQESYSVIRKILTNFIKEQKSFKNIQYYSVAKRIIDAFNMGYEFIEKLIDTINTFFEVRQDLYNRVASTQIPVIVYTGEESNLPIIFDRINSKGTPLDQYEIYAAAWPVNEKYKINNSEVIEYIVKKYDSFVKDGYAIHGYSSEEMRITREVNAFEYLFGLGKYLVDKYDILRFQKNIADDVVNPIAFELINACLNDSDKIRQLYKNLQNIDLNALENALCKAIDFVAGSISVVTKFKGNSRNTNKIFHSKYQILSMISTTFKEMYAHGEYTGFTDSWAERKLIIEKNLFHYYVYDIITNYWSEGGTGKIHAAAKPNRYMNEIASRSWMVALDGFFERSMSRTETKKIRNPNSEEFVVLNCIYLKTFTAMDQLSIDRFDVEHIAPKEQMKKLIEICKGDGLPISCIANLCYLPERVNRSKKDKNFYQDMNYIEHVKLDEIEAKYSFTEESDLDWMDVPYEAPEDFSVLKEYYTEYCTQRFDKIKYLFFDSLGIMYEDVKEETIFELPDRMISGKNASIQINDEYVEILKEKLDIELLKVGKSLYVTSDRKKGFLIIRSKEQVQANRDRYWFSYRRKRLKPLNECEDVFIVFVCKDESIMVKMPIALIEENIEALNASKNDMGEVKHWHIVFFKDKLGNMTWHLSKPVAQEIKLDGYLI